MKKVMVFGTFDIFHKGHINFLKQAKQYGDYLIVVVARDKTVLEVKGKLPKNNENKRMQEIKRSGLAESVILGNLKNKYVVINKHQPEIICLGYDQQFFIDKLNRALNKFDLKNTKVIRLKAFKPEVYKSSKLKDETAIMYEDIAREINKYKNKERAVVLASFFKTKRGQYGAGDKFLGLNVPTQRKIAEKYLRAELEGVEKLLASPYHEFRLTGLLILNYKYEKADNRLREKIYKFYIKNINAVNSWDLVDLTAPNIVGRYLWESEQKKDLLYKLVKSKNLWERRTAMLATFYFLKNKKFGDTLKIAQILLKDKEDLIHKAVGWMLREVGKRDMGALEIFLNKHASIMPRTMLRYSLEKLSPERRSYYMQKK